MFASGHASVIVQRVVMPVTGAVSWTVLGDDGAPLEPVESLPRLPGGAGALAEHAAGLRDEPEAVVRVPRSRRTSSWADGRRRRRRPVRVVAAGAGRQRVVLDAGTARRSAATVNRHLAAVFGFYEHHARSGVDVAAGLVAWRRVGRGSYKPFLHHVTKGRPDPDAAGEAAPSRAGRRGR